VSSKSKKGSQTTVLLPLQNIY